MTSFAPVFKVLISCGADVNDPFRDIAQECLRLVSQMFTQELGTTVSLLEWDYRDAAPGVVQTGHLGDKSIAVAGDADMVLPILGAGVPPVTRDEVRAAAARIAGGDSNEILTFIHTGLKTDENDQFLNEINEEFGLELVYTPFDSELLFQGRVIIALMPWVLKRLGWQPERTEVSVA